MFRGSYFNCAPDEDGEQVCCFVWGVLCFLKKKKNENSNKETSVVQSS